MALNYNMAAVDGVVITTAATVVTEPFVFVPGSVQSIALQSDFTYGSSGTTVKVYLQTSLDAGSKWVDIAAHAFATTSLNKVSAVRRAVARAEAVVTDGTLSDDTELDGLIGDRVRIKYVSVGTYATSTTLNVDLVLS